MHMVFPHTFGYYRVCKDIFPSSVIHTSDGKTNWNAHYFIKSHKQSGNNLPLVWVRNIIQSGFQKKLTITPCCVASCRQMSMITW